MLAYRLELTRSILFFVAATGNVVDLTSAELALIQLLIIRLPMPSPILKRFMTLILVAGVQVTHADPVPESAVIVQFQLSGQSAERIEETIVSPLERALLILARVKGIKSTASDHNAYVEITFEGGASDLDLASVADQIKKLDLSESVGETSSSLKLGKPQLGFIASASTQPE